MGASAVETSGSAASEARPPGRAAPLFARREWFDAWAASFGGAAYSIHRGGGDSPFELACMADRVSVAGIAFPIVRSATNAHTPRYDALGGEPDAEALQAMVARLGVAMAEFVGIADDSRLLARTRRGAGRWLDVSTAELAPQADCTSTWDDYWKSRGRNLRANLASIERKLAGHDVELRVIDDAATIREAMPVAYAIEAAGWKGRGQSAIVQRADTRSFYDALVHAFAPRGWLRLYLLRIDGIDVAFELCTLHDAVLTGLKGGYLESHAQLSPGQLLRKRFLERAFGDRDVRLYDMLGPASETKLRWSTRTETLRTLRVFARTPSGLALRSRFVTGPRLKRRLLATRTRAAPGRERDE